MIAEDEAMLDQALGLRAFGAAWFESSGSEFVEQASLPVALSAGHGQAFIRLVAVSGSMGPIIQYNKSRNRDGSRDYLRAGGIGYRWIPSDTPGSVAVQFRELAAETLKVARSITSADIVRHDGSRVRSIRIGRHARRWYLDRPSPDRQLCDESTVVTYRLKSETLD